MVRLSNAGGYEGRINWGLSGATSGLTAIMRVTRFLVMVDAHAYYSNDFGRLNGASGRASAQFPISFLVPNDTLTINAEAQMLGVAYGASGIQLHYHGSATYGLQF